MKDFIKLSRRGFLKAAGIAAGYAVLGFNMTKEVIAATMEFIGLRQKSVYKADATVFKIRKSQDNPMIKKLYDKNKGFLPQGPCSHKSHELLHTHYYNRSAKIKALKSKGIKLSL